MLMITQVWESPVKWKACGTSVEKGISSAGVASLGLYSLAVKWWEGRLPPFSFTLLGCCIGKKNTDLNFLICGSERMKHVLLVFMQAWEVCLICCIEWLACVLTLCSHVCGVAEPRAEKEQGWINLSHVWASWWHILAGLTTLDTQPPSSENMNS